MGDILGFPVLAPKFKFYYKGGYGGSFSYTNTNKMLSLWREVLGCGYSGEG
jgi:hypothetical protein